LSVVAFHAFPNWIQGGFIGVDIFFVISGFLISTIIFENLDKGTFSFAEFYARRVKRIFPALFLVLIASYVFGWFSLLPDEYKQLGKHTASGAGFVSNIAFWKEAGYFDTSAETKPLLHLWSLGIEEQFYIIWPFVLWLAWKKQFNLFTITIVFAVISFLLNIQGVKHDAVATFYSPQTRFWELLCGSLLAWICIYKQGLCSDFALKLDGWLGRVTYGKAPAANSKALTDALSFIGLFLLAYGFLNINKDLFFPGNWAAIPVLGTVILISAGSKAWINRIVLSNRLAVWFGLISFPLYLWHWPILSFARIVDSATPSRNIRIAAMLMSILLAWLTYKLLERHVRLPGYSRIKVAILITLMTIVGCVGYNTYIREGLPFRMKDREEFAGYFENSFPSWKYFKKINILSEWRNECAFFNGKRYLEEGKLEVGVTDKPVDALDSSCYARNLNFEKSVLIWGDSHAQSLSPGITSFIPKNWQVLQIASSGCAPSPNEKIPSPDDQCKQSNYFAIKTIREAKPDVVVVAQGGGHSVETMEEIKIQLENLGIKKILFLGPTPQWTANLPKIISRQLWVTKPKRTFLGLNQVIMNSNIQLLKNFKASEKSKYIDIIGFFCNKDGCLTYTDADMKDSITTWDYGHLTPSASKYLAKNLLVEKIIKD
jgi:peptidoglycan/LPS O-acetylase OafA/YrhL